MSVSTEVKGRLLDKKQDQWFGTQNIKLDNGGYSYFICESYDKYHRDPETRRFVTYCSLKNVPIEEANCGMDCEKYGRCSTCVGFSADRCIACDVIRPEP